MITPILRKITEDKKVCKLFILVSFLFSVCLPFLLKLPLASALKDTIDSINMSFVIGYQLYFVLGYYLAEYKVSFKIEMISYILGVVGIFIELFLVQSNYGADLNQLFTYFSLPVFFVSVSVLILFKERINLYLKYNQHVIKISNMTLGVYLVHLMLISILMHLIKSASLIMPLIMVPIIGVGIFLICILIVKIIQKIPIINIIVK